MAAKLAKSYVGLSPQVIATSGPALVKVVHAMEAFVHQCKTARYNVRGNPEATAVTLICTQVEDSLHVLGDPLVTRATVLGVQVNYNLAFVAENSGLEPFPLDLDDPVKIVEVLADTWTAVCEIAREQTQVMRDAGDPVSAHVTEHQSMCLEAMTTVLQDVLGRDPGEALEAIGTEGRVQL
jgi:DNA-binding ferritin-like protein